MATSGNKRLEIEKCDGGQPSLQTSLETSGNVLGVSSGNVPAADGSGIEREHSRWILKWYLAGTFPVYL